MGVTTTAVLLVLVASIAVTAGISSLYLAKDLMMRVHFNTELYFIYFVPQQNHALVRLAPPADSLNRLKQALYGQPIRNISLAYLKPSGDKYTICSRYSTKLRNKHW